MAKGKGFRILKFSTLFAACRREGRPVQHSQGESAERAKGLRQNSSLGRARRMLLKCINFKMWIVDVGVPASQRAGLYTHTPAGFRLSLH
jgi:hypothetical protein